MAKILPRLCGSLQYWVGDDSRQRSNEASVAQTQTSTTMFSKVLRSQPLHFHTHTASVGISRCWSDNDDLGVEYTQTYTPTLALSTAERLTERRDYSGSEWDWD